MFVNNLYNTIFSIIAINISIKYKQKIFNKNPVIAIYGIKLYCSFLFSIETKGFNIRTKHVKIAIKPK